MSELERPTDAPRGPAMGHAGPHGDVRRLRRLRRELAVARADAPSAPRRSTGRPLPIGLLAMGGLGGSARVARSLATTLANSGHPVHLFTSTSAHAHWRDDKLAPVHVHPVGLAAVPGPPRARVDPDDPTVQRLVAALREHGLHDVAVHYTSGLLGVALAARRLLAQDGHALRICASLHGTDVTGWTDGESRRVLARQLSECDAITAVSRWLATRAQQTFGLARTPTVIPNAVDASLFRPPAIGWRGARPDGPVIAHISNFRPVKRSLDAPAVLAELHALGVPARMLLLGDGPERAAVLRRCARLGLEPWIDAPGPLQPEVLATSLWDADIALVTSASESFSLAALEAMASGVPVVGTRCGGLEEVVDTIEGLSSASVTRPLSRLLAEVGDAPGLAARIADLLDEPAFARAVFHALRAATGGPFRPPEQASAYLEVLRAMAI